VRATERATVREAIDLLMEDDGDFARAVSLLCGLVGMRLPQHDLTQGVRILPPEEWHTIPEGPFKVLGQEIPE